MPWCKKATFHFTNCSKVFCQSPAIHLLGPITMACSFQWGLFSVLLRSSCVAGKIQHRMEADIKPRYNVNTLILQVKKSVFQAENGFPVLLTSLWTESYIILGPVQPGKQNQQIKHSLPHKFKIHYLSKYQTIHRVCKLSTCFAALLKCLWCITYHSKVFQCRMKRSVISTHPLQYRTWVLISGRKEHSTGSSTIILGAEANSLVSNSSWVTNTQRPA